MARKPVEQTGLGYLQSLVRVSMVVSESIYGFEGIDAPSAASHQLRKQTGIDSGSKLGRSNCQFLQCGRDSTPQRATSSSAPRRAERRFESDSKFP
jgi:hypothetical protein